MCKKTPEKKQIKIQDVLLSTRSPFFVDLPLSFCSIKYGRSALACLCKAAASPSKLLIKQSFKSIRQFLFMPKSTILFITQGTVDNTVGSGRLADTKALTTQLLQTTNPLIARLLPRSLAFVCMVIICVCFQSIIKAIRYIHTDQP